jgi:hypothetical protein
MDPSPLSTIQKALQINLDLAKYGAFAEIGAGQEVARWFFHVGRAANTVAKTISAYDMSVSDAIYGKCERYVSRQRLEAMLTHEYDLVLERLQTTRGERSTFFAFADTVATRHPARQENGHGWIGLRFQTAPGAPPSQIIIHVHLLDREGARAQEALGIVGVNLIHAAFFEHQRPASLVLALRDELTRDRVEIDMIQLSGPAFAGVDNRLMSLHLVENDFTDAAMFHTSGEVVQPSEVLYKRPVLVERGSFRPITNVTLDLLKQSYARFVLDERLDGEPPIVLLEMTLRNLTSASGVDYADFLARVDILGALGQTVLISDFGRYFRLVEYLSQYTQKMIGIALGIPSLTQVADARNYTDLPGGMLESTGRLFRENVKLYVYPYRDPGSGEILTAETMHVAPTARHLHSYLLENGFVETLTNYNPDFLSISTTDVLAKIQSGDSSWEQLVPSPIVDIIRRDGLFGCRV